MLSFSESQHGYSQLQIGTCHLPVQKQNHVLQAADFQLSLKGGQSAEHSVLWEKLAGQVIRLLDISRDQFYEPNSCISS